MYFSIYSFILVSNEYVFVGVCLVKQFFVRMEKIMLFFFEVEYKFLLILEDSRIEMKFFLDVVSEIVLFFGE